tara:strand:+ start:36659 stop:38116 length:1458 start_codon:yes stop_codon:yes gene_type:complete
MTELLTILIIVLYFTFLFLISKWTKGSEDNDTFFLGKRSSPWYIVAYGMVGVSLSGITFLSVPGWVKTQEFYYMQMVLGFVPGYIFVAYILMPIYYKMKVYSIYEYLKDRFGYFSHKSGAFFFFLSRTLGASLRLFLVAKVLDLLFFSSFNIPFFVTSLLTIFFIWVYTHKGGIKTIIWTDTLQTTFMLLTVVICIYVIFKDLGFESIIQSIEQNKLDLNFFLFDDFNDNRHFIRYFLSGMFISIAMTGLDQDMMQKNLSCKNIKEAQRNMVCFSLVLVFVNLLFLYLGSLLYEFASVNNIISDGDNLFVEIIKSEKLGVFVFITFLLGLMSAAYSSADSALTSLTTSFCIDFLEMDTNKPNKTNILKRKKVHIFISFLLLCIILLVHYLNDDNIISTLFTLASYTYGPLLGLFFFGIFTKRNINDHYVPFVVIFSPLLTYIISTYDELLIRFNFGYELLIINGLITFICLFLISKPKSFLFDLE